MNIVVRPIKGHLLRSLRRMARARGMSLNDCVLAVLDEATQGIEPVGASPGGSAEATSASHDAE